jgi:transcriptional regulator with XRE-family HTH domain
MVVLCPWRSYCAHVTQPAAPTATIARQVRELRNARGWSGQRLAQEMTEQGIDWDRSIVANLENGRRRTVSVEEWLALARVLGVAPVHLLLPIEEDGEFAVTPRAIEQLAEARAWVRGYRALAGDSTWFHRHRPPAAPADDDADVRDRLVTLEQAMIQLTNAMVERSPGGSAFITTSGEPTKWLKGGPDDGEHQAPS